MKESVEGWIKRGSVEGQPLEIRLVTIALHCGVW